MRVIVIILSLITGLFVPVLGRELYVVASRDAIVRADPDKSSEPLLKLKQGDKLNLVTDQQTNRFYKVFLPNRETGWVSSYVVRLYEGRAPDIPQATVVTDKSDSFASKEREYTEFHLAIGKPQGFKEIIREGYVLGYDPRLKIPVWVQYRLTQARSEDNSFPRSNAFDEDISIPPQARAKLGDYTAQGGRYVRGHMAPAEDMRWGKSAEAESNLLTNIAPQIGSTFNSSIWKSIEDKVRGWVIDRKDLTIICGPVFKARPRVFRIERQPETDRQMLYNVIGENGVAVPTAFYKIIVDMRNQQKPDVLAFLVPHIETASGPERRIETYITSVDSIEKLTGLDFLTNLPEKVQADIESTPATNPW